jgi:membrane associated rhomboid family serine protease
MIPRSKEAIKDMIISGAFIVMGLFLPGSLLDTGFEAHVGGIAVGTGIGWIVKSIIDHTKGVKRESED